MTPLIKAALAYWTEQHHSDKGTKRAIKMKLAPGSLTTGYHNILSWSGYKLFHRNRIFFNPPPVMKITRMLVTADTHSKVCLQRYHYTW